MLDHRMRKYCTMCDFIIYKMEFVFVCVCDKTEHWTLASIFWRVNSSIWREHTKIETHCSFTRKCDIFHWTAAWQLHLESHWTISTKNVIAVNILGLSDLLTVNAFKIMTKLEQANENKKNLSLIVKFSFSI